MSVDISQFHQVYFEESFEGLDAMESGLLALSTGEPDSETINVIFRAAHSIKGGAGTFGFRQISDFTHVMETLLDEMRAGKRMVTPAAVDLLLRSTDQLGGLLTAARDKTEPDADAISDTLAELQAMLEEAPSAAAAPVVAAAPTAAPIGWRIRFAPQPQLFMTGNDPARLLRELVALGPCAINCDLSQLPAAGAEFDPETCYIAWDIALSAPVEEAAVREVFEWVDGDAEILIEAVRPAVSAPPVAAAPAVSTAQQEADQEEQARRADDRRQGDRRAGDRRQGDRRDGAAGASTSSIRVDIGKVDALINMIGQLVITQSMLLDLGQDITPEKTIKLREGLAQLERNTRDLQESIMNIRMMPISFSFNRFPRLVRDLSTKLGKEVQLKLAGEETEVDKTVLEKIGDPLVHLVRNALDHGLETPDVREASGKSRVGTLSLNAYHEGGSVVIDISDDGAGLNRDRILAKARERGIIDAHVQPTDAQVYDCIFAPGFSTAAVVSDVSGRGVGMDVVRRNIRDLGGTVDVHSTPGQGATFRIRLPLTLAILDGQLVRVGSNVYIISLVSIIESLQVEAGNVQTVSGSCELYSLRSEYLPVLRLYDMFGVQPDSTDLTEGLLVVVEAMGKKVALLVDELLGQQQVVVKSLQTNFRNVNGISGATILGTGSVAMILDVNGLVRLSRERYADLPLVPNTFRMAQQETLQ